MCALNWQQWTLIRHICSSECDHLMERMNNGYNIMIHLLPFHIRIISVICTMPWKLLNRCYSLNIHIDRSNEMLQIFLQYVMLLSEIASLFIARNKMNTFSHMHSIPSSPPSIVAEFSSQKPIEHFKFFNFRKLSKWTSIAIDVMI